MCTELVWLSMRQAPIVPHGPTPAINLTLALQVLGGKMPFSEHDDLTVTAIIWAGETPRRPPAGINDTVWLFLEKCWSNVPSERPSITQVCDALLKFRFLPQTPITRVGRLTVEDLPRGIVLQVESLETSPKKSDRRRFFIKFESGWLSKHTTSLSRRTVAGRHMWYCTHF